MIRTCTVRLKVVLAVFLTLLGCSRPSDDMLNVTVKEPVQKDFEAIRQTGVLKVITRYNSMTYFLHRGVERGFEYEFLREFAKSHGMGLEIVMMPSDRNPIDLLNNGEGDVIAANYTTTDERRNYVAFSRPYNFVNQVIVLPDRFADVPQDMEQLGRTKIHVRKGSSYYANLVRLKEERGLPFRIEILPEDYDTEAIILGVAKGEYEATVADDNLFAAAQKYITGIIAGPTLSEQDTVAWAIRKNAPQLKAAMDRFLVEHFRFRDAGQPPFRSTLMNVLRHRYFENERTLSAFSTTVQETKYAGVISPYDKLIRPIADSAGVDWLLVVALTAQESKFDPNAQSWAGAVGLMQILHRFSKHSEQDLLEPEINVREGVRILKEHLDHYSYMDVQNQMAFALATYNAGMGHIADARRLAIDKNRNPNDWNAVADALLLLMKRQFYQDARYGFARGIETVSYVREVMNRYALYQTIGSITRQEGSPQEFRPGVLGYTGMVK